MCALSVACVCFYKENTQNEYRNTECVATLQTCKVYKQMDKYSAANKMQVSFWGVQHH